MIFQILILAILYSAIQHYLVHNTFSSTQTVYRRSICYLLCKIFQWMGLGLLWITIVNIEDGWGWGGRKLRGGHVELWQWSIIIIIGTPKLPRTPTAAPPLSSLPTLIFCTHCSHCMSSSSRTGTEAEALTLSEAWLSMCLSPQLFDSRAF